MAFKGVDYYQLDDLLSDDEKMVRNLTREFMEQKVLEILGCLMLPHVFCYGHRYNPYSFTCAMHGTCIPTLFEPCPVIR